MNISENNVLEMKNVLSYRGKVTQTQMAEKIQEIGKVIKTVGAQRAGHITTATFAVEQDAMTQVMNIEILVPLDREISVPTGYEWKPRFYLI